MSAPLVRPRSKYGATAVTFLGHRFHSAREAYRYEQLVKRQTAGEIAELRLQVPFELHAPGGQVIGRYVADFTYVVPPSAELVVEDVKGFRTEMYRWKKKHVEAEYGVRVVEV